MQALAFRKTVTMDQTNMHEKLLQRLGEESIRYCAIGGQAVNAYVEPLVSLDLDLVVAVNQLEEVEKLFANHFQLKRFPDSLNVSLEGSDLRVQIQTDPRYANFVQRATEREVLGLVMPVASLEDVMQSKIWTVQDPERHRSKRQKDLADIARIIEAYPSIRQQVPEEVLALLL